MFGFKIIKINGHSMEPGLSHGSFVIISSKIRKYLPGNMVLFIYDSKRLIKRISKIEGNLVFVQGDNKVDSLNIPPIKKDLILGKVVWP